MKSAVFLKNEGDLDLLKEASKVLQANPGTRQIGIRLETGDIAGLTQDIALSAGVVAAGAAGVGALGGGGGAAASAGASKGIAGQVAARGAGALNTKLVGLLSGSILLNSVMGAFMSAPNNAIGKAFNEFASDNNMDLEPLMRKAQIELFTVPFVDPDTGELRFIDADGSLLRQRLREAGVSKDNIEREMQRHGAERQGNEKFIGQFSSGQIGEEGKSFQEQALAGEEPLETLQRLQKEKITTDKETMKAEETQRQQLEAGVQAIPERPELAGTPAQQTETALEDPAMMELKRRQAFNERLPVAGPPQQVEEAPTPIDFAVQKQGGGQSDDVRLAAAQEREAARKASEEKKELILVRKRKGL